MRENGLQARTKRRYRCTTRAAERRPVAENLLARKFTVSRKNAVWASDITYIRTWEGWLYLAVVIDLYSRRVVGWAIADHIRTELVMSALRKAFATHEIANQAD